VRSPLEENLLNITHRTYLWLKLIFEVIYNQLKITKKTLRQSVGIIPETVNDAYEAILKRSTDRELAKKLLHIVVAGVRPLTLKEMNVALAMEDHSRSYEDLDLENEDNFHTTVRNVCGLFVSIVDGRIYLIHQTAKDFLVYNEDAVQSPCPGIWKHSLKPRESNLVLAKSCIWYLLFTVFESHPLIIDEVRNHGIKKAVKRYTKEHDFLDYAAKNWADHFRTAKITKNADAALLKSTLEVCDTRSKRFMTWFQLYWISVGGYSQCPQNFTGLMVGSFFGHEAVVKGQLDQKAEVDAKDEDGWTALHWAAIRGHEAVVQLLLENKADLEGADKTGMTAVMLAAHHGQLATITVLLENGADIEAEDKYGTPLIRASKGGHEAVVRFLLKREAKPSARDHMWENSTTLGC
jgi:ankyrin repeat domain-containing protein 50